MILSCEPIYLRISFDVGSQNNKFMLKYKKDYFVMVDSCF